MAKIAPQTGPWRLTGGNRYERWSRLGVLLRELVPPEWRLGHDPNDQDRPVLFIDPADPVWPSQPGQPGVAGEPSGSVAYTGEPGGTGQQVVEIATQCVGVPYIWGGEDPRTGMDCSGLVNYVYRQVGVQLPRTAQAIYSSPNLPKVTWPERQPGDIILFWSPTDGRTVSHVGLYIGNDQMIHASSTRKAVRIERLTEYYLQRYAGLRRPLALRSEQPPWVQTHVGISQFGGDPMKLGPDQLGQIAQDYTDEELADGIRVAEGVNSHYPYGITAPGHKDKARDNEPYARRICLATIRNNRIRWAKADKRRYPTYLPFLADRYVMTGQTSELARRNRLNWMRNIVATVEKQRAAQRARSQPRASGASPR